MKKLTIGKIRGLQQIATRDGVFTMAAMDHRGSLETMLGGGKAGGADEAMVELKLELCTALGPHASAVLLDPIFGAAQCIIHGVLPKGVGLLVSIEATGYTGGKEARVTGLLEGWSVEKIKRMGASAVKMLVYYRPDLKDLAANQLKTIRRVADDCIKYDIPFLTEAVSYPVGEEVSNAELFCEHKGKIVEDTARDITNLPIDVLKAEFPADLRYKKDKAELIELCRKVDAASQAPWVILSAGVDFDTFRQQVEVACQSGASGFLGGRAIWQEAARIEDRQERVKYLSTVAVDRLKTLVEITTRYATPWYRKLGLSANALAEVSPQWYQKY